jgi:hypothetical protein
VAGSAEQVEPLLRAAPETDVFADPFDESPASVSQPPVLVVLDDGEADDAVRAIERDLRAVAAARGVRVHTVTADEGPDVARFASLLSVGRFAAVYLSMGQSSS